MKALTTALAIAALSLPASALAADGTVPDAGAAVDGGAKEAGPPVAVPTTVKEAIETGKGAIEAAKSGNWWLFAALAVTVLLFLVKLLGTKVLGFWRKLGRWRYVIPPVLSLAAALLAAFQGGVSVDAAVGVFTASWATSSLQELWEHGILGKPRKGAGDGDG